MHQLLSDRGKIQKYVNSEDQNTAVKKQMEKSADYTAHKLPENRMRVFAAVCSMPVLFESISFHRNNFIIGS